MRIIRPHGQSRTERSNGSLKRKIQRKDSLVEIPTFAEKEPKLLVAQWMGVIDKIIRKPNRRKKELLSPLHKDLRQALGDACWKRLENKLPEDQREELKKVWDWKLHAYEVKKTDKITNEIRKQMRGRWFDAFCGRDTQLEYVEKNAAEIAERIEQHLHEDRLRIDGKKISKTVRNAKNEKGLVRQRAESIEKSVPKADINFDDPPWWNVDLAALKCDFAKAIYQANEEAMHGQRDGYKRRLYSGEAGEIISEAYALQFADGQHGVKSREQIEQEMPEMLAFFDEARRYYKRFFRNTRKEHASMKQVLPRNARALLERLKQVHDNRITNALIRLGRVMHFEAMRLCPDDMKTGLNRVLQGGVDSSHYWTSDGQAEIKRAEAFVRVWRQALAQAGLTLRAWADPDHQVSGDILGIGERFNDAIRRIEDTGRDVSRHVHLLFGSRAGVMLQKADALKLLKTIGSIARKARHKSFHVNERKRFAKNLSGIGQEDEAALAAFHHLLEADFKERFEHLDRECQGALLHQFATPEELNGYRKLVLGAQEAQTVLPAFKQLLKRLKNAGLHKLGKDKGTLPPPPGDTNRDAPWWRAKYTGLKLAYEGPFRHWLAQETKEDGNFLTNFMKEAAERGTEKARDLWKEQPAEVIYSRAEQLLREKWAGGGLDEFLKLLTSETASEMRVQSGYNPNREGARTQAEWIRNFERDVIGLAFRQFCKEHEQALGWLCRLDEKSSRDEKAEYPSELPEDISPPQNTLTADWHAALYALLHLMPVEAIAQLAHQFRKWEVLEDIKGSGKVEDSERAIGQLLQLAIDMHDAKFTGQEEKNELAVFREFYEKPEDFDRLFLNEDAPDPERHSGLMRDLRQIMRFGHLPLVRSLAGGEKVSHEDVDKLLDWELKPEKPDRDGCRLSHIARQQEQRMKLHEKLVRKKKEEITPGEWNEYGRLARAVAGHRTLAAHVRLQNHVRVHRLLVRLAARLVDFAGLWERDLYYITLALSHLHNLSLLDELFPPANQTSGKILRSVRNDFRKQGKVAIDRLQTDVRKGLRRWHRPGESDRRNAIAHFDVLHRRPICFTSMVNDTRSLVDYDRKLKNAVAKAIIDMMHREGLELKWRMHDHQLDAATLKARRIEHLKGKQPKDCKAIEEWLHGKEFVRMLQRAFPAIDPPAGNRQNKGNTRHHGKSSGKKAAATGRNAHGAGTRNQQGKGHKKVQKSRYNAGKLGHNEGKK